MSQLYKFLKNEGFAYITLKTADFLSADISTNFINLNVLSLRRYRTILKKRFSNFHEKIKNTHSICILRGMKNEAEVYSSFTSLLDLSEDLYFLVISVYLNYNTGKNKLLNINFTHTHTHTHTKNEKKEQFT